MKTSRRRFIGACGAAAAAGFPRIGNGGGRTERTPNFVLIFTDDQGYADLSCCGSTDISTPNIDRLAAEGTRFTDFYVPVPLCSPSRAALLTGCYPRRIGLGTGVLRPDSTRGIGPDEITIAQLLKQAGYTTGCIGKWHLGFLPPFLPNSKGFDFYYGPLHNLDHWETKFYDDEGGMPIRRNNTPEIRPATPDILTELYTKEAIGFIRENKDQPFFLYLAHTMPHDPIDASARFKGKSKGGLYGDVIECLDWSTGEIRKTLDELELTEDTIVIYTSDNGPSPLNTGSALPLRGRKHMTYDGGLRVPCIMWAPGRIPAGRVCKELTTSMDIYPTFAALAGVAVPTDRIIDGRDIWPIISGQPGAVSPHKAFFYHNGQSVLCAVRVGKWKLHLGVKGKKSKAGNDAATQELYDLEDDIGESRNVAEEHPEVVERLRKMANAFEADLRKNSRPCGQM